MLNLYPKFSWAIPVALLFCLSLPSRTCAQQLYWYLSDMQNPTTPVTVADMSGFWPAAQVLVMGDIQAQAAGTFVWDDSSFATDAPAAIAACHANGCKALIDIGPFGNLPSALTSHQSLLITNLMSIVNTYGFDGVAIDWEISFSTTLNTTFITALRTALGSKIIEQVADQYSYSTYYGGAIQSSLDKEIILLYDMGGCQTSGTWYDQAVYNSASGIGSFANGYSSYEFFRQRMEGAGVPASKLLFGVAFTGRVFTGMGAAPYLTCSGGGSGGDVGYNTLSGLYTLTSPNRDSVTLEPWIVTSGGWTDFEDPISVAAKIKYDIANNLGWIVFSSIQDLFPSQTPKHPLLAAIVAQMTPSINTYVAANRVVHTSGGVVQ